MIIKILANLSDIIVNLFTVMFGGKVTINGTTKGGEQISQELVIGPSFPLILGFIFIIVSFALLLLILVGYYSREFKKGTLTVLATVTITLLVVGGILFCMTPVFAKANLIGEYARIMRAAGTEETIVQYMISSLNDGFSAKIGADAIIASSCAFCAAGATLVALLGLHLRKAEPVAIK